MLSFRTLFLSALILSTLHSISWAAECATPGNDGSGTFIGVVNTYWTGSSNPSVGTTNFSLGPATGATTPISAGDLLMIIQIQDANISRNNSASYGDGNNTDPASGYTNIRRAGRYEYVRATNTVPLSGGTLNISSGIIYDYTSSPATSNRGQRSFQIIRVPQYTDLTVTGTLTAAPWDGIQGGVFVVDVANTLTFSGGTVDVSEIGFRGGGGRVASSGSGSNTDYVTTFSNQANGAKGESIAGTPQLVFNGTSVVDTGIDGYPNGSFARGAPANGGGGATDGDPSRNNQNAGGGGGGGYGDGGKGGHSWCPGGPAVCAQSGGFGGKGVTTQAADRLVMGGGGGAGTTNNNTGSPSGSIASSGARGGGIAIIRAKTITGSAVISANGQDANQTVGNDGAGGGGGGGAILIDADDTTAASLSAIANGGAGGTNGNSSPHGPGGGGGGGFVAYTAGVTGLAVTTNAGQPGTTDGNPAPFDQHYGATNGVGGQTTSVNGPSIPGFSSGDECIVDIDKDFAVDSSTPNSPVQLTLSLTNPNPDLAMSAVAVTDNYPAGIQNAPTPNAATSCGGSVTATAGGTSLALSGGTIPAGGSCTATVEVVGTSGGSYLNTIPAGDATASISGQTVSNLLPTDDTLEITQPLSAQKTVAIISDDINGTSAPYALPGAIVEYTIGFSNPSSVPVDTNTIVITDAIPANTTFSNTAIAAGLPVAFDDGSPLSGLSMGAANITYSNDGGATYTYLPNGATDSNVTHIRVSLTGAMSASTSAAIRFRVKIN